jgi:hypothetical protein
MSLICPRCGGEGHLAVWGVSRPDVACGACGGGGLLPEAPDLDEEETTAQPRGVQLVWWWWPWQFGPVGPYPFSGVHRGCIYRWRFCLGPVEIRRWA